MGCLLRRCEEEGLCGPEMPPRQRRALAQLQRVADGLERLFASLEASAAQAGMQSSKDVAGEHEEKLQQGNSATPSSFSLMLGASSSEAGLQASREATSIQLDIADGGWVSSRGISGPALPESKLELVKQLELYNVLPGNECLP
jgi:hypothetical protein